MENKDGQQIDRLRIDRLLSYLHLTKTRGAAQRLIAEGHIRCNGGRVTRQNRAIAVGDVLTLPLADRVQVIEILSIPDRRGPAIEAQSCYQVLDAGGSIAIADDKSAPGALSEEGKPPS